MIYTKEELKNIADEANKPNVAIEIELLFKKMEVEAKDGKYSFGTKERVFPATTAHFRSLGFRVFQESIFWTIYWD